MPYSPPTGTVNLSIGGALGYTPPTGTVNLSIGHTDSADWVAALAGETLAPTGLLALLQVRQAVIAGETLPPLGLLELSAPEPAEPVVIAGETLAPIGLLIGAFDPNLLDQLTAGIRSGWQAGRASPVGSAARWQPAAWAGRAALPGWTAGAATARGVASRFQSAAPLQGAGQTRWNEAQPESTGKTSAWQAAGSVRAGRVTRWQPGRLTLGAGVERFRVRLPVLTPDAVAGWNAGAPVTARLALGFRDGAPIPLALVEIWQPAGYPGNAPRPPKDPIPPVVRPPWGTALKIRCPLPGTALHLGRVPCILIPEREIAVRRTYMSINSAALVRWPDLTPLPCTSITIETDFESWCWALSATLAGPDAWALVQPDPLACQVQATINGQVWRFLLDVPSTQESFNSDRVSLKGRSRSAWLHDPYTPSLDYSEASPREMEQLAEAALDNTGWAVDWQLDNWVVPGGRYVGYNTPIGCLIRLVNATDDGIYTHPSDQVIALQKRWPVASWLLDAAVVDLAIPADAVVSLSQSPVYSQPYNGVYVSGTSHGALALVKIAGTDGALQPAEPITHELLCDTAGVAARRRGINALSDSGAGFTMDAEVLFTPEVGLIRPGLIVSIAGMKGLSRSCRITAQWNNGLSVRQSVGLERREVEA